MPEPRKTGAAGQVEAFFNTMRHTTNIGDNNLQFEEEQGSSNRAVVTHLMIEGIKNFINKDSMKTWISVGDAWRMTFNDRVTQVHNTKNSA